VFASRFLVFRWEGFTLKLVVWSVSALLKLLLLGIVIFVVVLGVVSVLVSVVEQRCRRTGGTKSNMCFILEIGWRRVTYFRKGPQI
jgi:hypothetical protein